MDSVNTLQTACEQPQISHEQSIEFHEHIGGQKWSPLPEQTRQQIIALREQGKTHREIASELNIGRATVSKYLQRFSQVLGTRVLSREQIQSAIFQFAPRAVQKIQNLSENAKKEDVQLKASQDILDRAGFSMVQKSLILGSLQLELANDTELNTQLDAIIKEADQLGFIK